MKQNILRILCVTGMIMAFVGFVAMVIYSETSAIKFWSVEMVFGMALCIICGVLMNDDEPKQRKVRRRRGRKRRWAT